MQMNILILDYPVVINFHVPACAGRCIQQSINQLQNSFEILKYKICKTLYIKSVVIYIRDN